MKGAFAGLIAVVLSMLLTGSAKAWEETPHLRVNYLAYPVAWNGRTIMIGARFQVPLNVKGPLPAVIILHGTSGVSYRGVYYAAALNRAGIATLEIDQWGGRDLAGEASSRPQNVDANLPDIAGAYRLLAGRPEIDASRIGIMGSSMGGGETMLMMTHQHSDALLGDGVHLKAAVALYPICWRFNHVPGADFRKLVDAPIRIFVGTSDDYDGGEAACEDLLRSLSPSDATHLSIRAFPGATHEFDVFDGERDFNDPRANCRHGGIVHVRPDPAAREQARDDLVQFFMNAFGQPPAAQGIAPN
ncbi:dienelactone hydrolase family protein [Paraburkholderia oxyphila]|uniref:dienelactone hydrolase family protein n=1 Tax=Paraburkholderia oxyphila TaxID=614212 RepID=UPI000693AA7E|nr:dienelactone hydrolase family protein [Paraburkholderia oxyphila]